MLSHDKGTELLNALEPLRAMPRRPHSRIDDVAGAASSLARKYIRLCDFADRHTLPWCLEIASAWAQVSAIATDHTRDGDATPIDEAGAEALISSLQRIARLEAADPRTEPFFFAGADGDQSVCAEIDALRDTFLRAFGHWSSRAVNTAEMRAAVGRPAPGRGVLLPPPPTEQSPAPAPPTPAPASLPLDTLPAPTPAPTVAPIRAPQARAALSRSAAPVELSAAGQRILSEIENAESADELKAIQKAVLDGNKTGALSADEAPRLVQEINARLRRGKGRAA